MQGPSTLASETLVLIPLPVERVEQDDGASDDSDCRPIQPKLCRRARGKESGAGEVVVGFKRPKGEQKLTWDEFWEQVGLYDSIPDEEVIDM